MENKILEDSYLKIAEQLPLADELCKAAFLAGVQVGLDLREIELINQVPG